MSRRWVCPTCGSGVNAPERPRVNDVRRYCLKCSAESGYLVQRSCPALEARRESAALRSRQKAKAVAEREKAKTLVRTRNARGEEVLIDVPAEVRRALREMGFKKAAGIQVDIRRRRDGESSGRAIPWEDRIVMSCGTKTENILEMAYHEAAHIAAGSDPSDTRRWHGERFRRTLADALQKRWPFLVYGSLRSQYAYGADWDIRKQMREHLLAGGEL